MKTPLSQNSGTILLLLQLRLRPSPPCTPLPHLTPLLYTPTVHKRVLPLVSNWLLALAKLLLLPPERCPRHLQHPAVLHHQRSSHTLHRMKETRWKVPQLHCHPQTKIHISKLKSNLVQTQNHPLQITAAPAALQLESQNQLPLIRQLAVKRMCVPHLLEVPPGPSLATLCVRSCVIKDIAIQGQW